MKFFALVLGVLGVLMAVVALGFLAAYPTMWLVNYLFAKSLLLSVFGVEKFNFWHAFALNVFNGWFLTRHDSKPKD